MPFPIHDIVPCVKTSAERTDAVLKKIQQLLYRNVTPKKYSNGQAFRWVIHEEECFGEWCMKILDLIIFVF